MALRDRLLGLTLDAVFGNTASLGAGLTLLVAASKMRSGAFTLGILHCLPPTSCRSKT